MIEDATRRLGAGVAYTGAVCLTFQRSNQGYLRVRRRAPVILIWVNTGTDSARHECHMASRDSEHRGRGAPVCPSARNDQGGFGDQDES
jgi:hypothetical protein